jgi:hypothetical protein
MKHHPTAPHVHTWRSLYEAALLELNPATHAALIHKAEQAIHKRFHELQAADEHERRALTDALIILGDLRRAIVDGSSTSAYDARINAVRHRRYTL